MYHCHSTLLVPMSAERPHEYKESAYELVVHRGIEEHRIVRTVERAMVTLMSAREYGRTSA
jgi:hypothetical protein